MKTKKIKFIFNLIKSVCAAFFGVQSNKNRIQDFNDGHHFTYYIATGIIIAAILVATLIAIVNYILNG